MPDLAVTLPTPVPYHLRRTLAGHRMGPGDPVLRFSGEAAAWALATPDGPAALRIEADDERGLLVEGWGRGTGWLRPHLPALLGLRDDPSGFRPEEPAVRRLWRRQAGQRLPRLPRVFARLVAVVLLQRVTSGEAQEAWRRLVRAYGEEAPGPLRLRVPPGPEVLAGLPGYALVERGVPHRQAETLRRLARSAPALEAAAAQGPEVLARRLAAVPGVGPWTVQYALGSVLGHPDAVLVGDDNLHDSVAWLLAGEERGSDARMLELLEPYRGHRFRVIRLVWASGRRAPRRGPGRRLAGSLDRGRRAG